MSRRPFLQFTRRARRDIKACIEFIRTQPWGKPQDRLQDLHRGIGKVLFGPHHAPIRHAVPRLGWISDAATPYGPLRADGVS